MAQPQLPPGPRFALLQALRLGRDPIAYFEGLQRRYGEVFSVPIPLFGRIAYFTDPAVAQEIFRGDPAVLHGGEANMGPLGPVLGTNAVNVLDDEPHLRERRLLLPPFHGERIKEYVHTFADCAAREVARWPVGEPFALLPRMQVLALEVLLRTVLGVTEEDRLAEYRRRVVHMMKVSNAIVYVPALRRDLGRLSPWGRFVRARADLDELVYDEMDRGRADPDLAEREDVLALLLQARREDGSSPTRKELRDEVMAVLLAGHETTAFSLSWFFERVLRHPDVERRLREERATGEDAFLEATVREVFRVRPTLFDIIRRTTRETELGGWTIPARTYVALATILLHRRPDVYDDPHEFRPERFLGENPSHYTWLTFGGGTRRCIGASYAMLEIKAIAGAILDHARLSVPDPRPERASARHIVVAPSRGARVVLEERLSVQAAETAATIPQSAGAVQDRVR